MWLQYDFGDGPLIDGVKTTLFVAWLAWSRFRVVLAIRDKTAPSVMAALDVTLRRLGGAPTYVLTDNEKTVTTEHVAGVLVRNQAMVAFARQSGVTIHTCVPADPASKGGSESSVKIAKADLVPKDTNLLPAYASFAALEAACEAFCEQVNARLTCTNTFTYAGMAPVVRSACDTKAPLSSHLSQPTPRHPPVRPATSPGTAAPCARVCDSRVPPSPLLSTSDSAHVGTRTLPVARRCTVLVAATGPEAPLPGRVSRSREGANAVNAPPWPDRSARRSGSSRRRQPPKRTHRRMRRPRIEATLGITGSGARLISLDDLGAYRMDQKTGEPHKLKNVTPERAAAGRTRRCSS